MFGSDSPGDGFSSFLIPLIVVLFLAVWRRVSDYGITEPRYIAIVYGLWLVAMVALFQIEQDGEYQSDFRLPLRIGVAHLLWSVGCLPDIRKKSDRET